MVRPGTRGELKALLEAGVSCEVALIAAEMTEIMLRGWLEFDAFSVSNSDNPGWALFAPTVTAKFRSKSRFAG